MVNSIINITQVIKHGVGKLAKTQLVFAFDYRQLLHKLKE